jgi:hypothetical protein
VFAGAAAVLIAGGLILAPFRAEHPEPWVAAATIALALATVWLGWQTRDVSRRTGDLVATTSEEIELLRQQTAAMKLQAESAQAQLDALERQRREDRRPVFVWRRLDTSLRRSSVGADERLQYIDVQVQAVNEGGHAIASELEIHSSLAELHDPATIHRVITIDGYVPVNLRFGPMRHDVDFRWTGSCSIKVRPLHGSDDETIRVRTEFRGRSWPDNLTFDLLDTSP